MFDHKKKKARRKLYKSKLTNSKLISTNNLKDNLKDCCFTTTLYHSLQLHLQPVRIEQFKSCRRDPNRGNPRDTACLVTNARGDGFRGCQTG